MDLSKLDPEDRDGVARAFDVATALAAEVMDINDQDFSYWERWNGPAPKTMEELQAAEKREREKRWRTVREWVAKHIQEDPHAD
jgi:hypothetical protein